MKTTSFKVLVSILLIFILVISTISCDGGINGDEAKALVNDFFAAIVDGDYEKAESLLHPDYPVDTEKLFSNVKERDGLDLQSGFSIEKYTGFSSSYYDSAVDGSTYGLDMRVKIGDKTAYVSVEIVKNDYGFGIYDLEIET